MTMEPKRALTLKSVIIGNKTIPADRLLWVQKRADGFSDVEYKDQKGRVPNGVIAPYPVKAPSLDELRKHDPCFGLPDSAFEIEYLDHDNYFMISRCKSHGSRFLRDTRGGVAMYELITLLDDSDIGSPDEVWRKYHHMSDSWLFLQGRTL